jgi:ribokinase
MNITVAGSSNIEMIIKVPRLPLQGETILGSDFTLTSGGKGVNQAVAAARLGGNVTFIGRIGNDMFGDQALKVLKQEGINTQYVAIDKHIPSGIAQIVADENGKKYITVAPGANQNLCEDDINNASEAIISADILLLQSELPLQPVRIAARIAHRNNIRVLLNPVSSVILDDDLLSYVSVLIPSKVEAETLTGIRITDHRSAELAGRILLEHGPEKVIITMGEKGAMVIDNGGAEHFSAIRIKPADATAASDVFCGAMAVALAEDKNFFEAVKFANTAAAISISKPGTLPSFPIRDEVLAFLKK